MKCGVAAVGTKVHSIRSLTRYGVATFSTKEHTIVELSEARCWYIIRNGTRNRGAYQGAVLIYVVLRGKQ